MRPRTACTACRKRQRRCIIKKSDIACVYCSQHQLECSLSPSIPAPSAQQRSLSQSDLRGPSSSGLQIPPLNVCMGITAAYFNYIHNPTHQLFHESTFMLDIANRRVSNAVLYAIIALAARFSTDDFFKRVEPRARGEPYIRAAQKLFNLHDLSHDTIRLAVLLGAYYGTDGDPNHESLYYTVACRIAGLIDVPELESPTSMERELDIRLYWTLQTIDLWSSNAVRLPRVLHPREDVPQPLPEGVFLDMRRGSDSTISFTSQLSASEQLTTSILAEKVRLNSIFAEIAQLTTASANKTVPGSEIHITTERLADELAKWRHQLSPWLLDSQDNLAFHASKGTGGAFTSLYLGYYHFSQLLFYRYLHLPNIPDYMIGPSAVGAYTYAERCRVNSTAICGTVYNAYSTPGAEVYYSLVGHVLVIASTIQLHILLFSENDAEINAARHRLERNFQILCKLQKFWGALDISLGRFQSFHEACMKSKTSSGGIGSAFRLDTWMVGFMMEFSKPLDERPDEEVVIVDDDITLSNSQMGDLEHDFAFDLHQWSVDTVGIDFQLGE